MKKNKPLKNSDKKQDLQSIIVNASIGDDYEIRPPGKKDIIVRGGARKKQFEITLDANIFPSVDVVINGKKKTVELKKKGDK